MDKIKVFIGWDPREIEAYEVCRASILEHAPNLDVVPLIKDQLWEYQREDNAATSEFTLTRFFVPFLSGYKGLSLFLDCDILCTTDIQTIMQSVDLSNMVSCVQHDYIPKSSIKMDGRKQTVYPRKNWSSVMLFNNEKCKVLSPDLLNVATPAYLHRFMWASDHSIGSLPHTWNYLSGYYDDIKLPNLIHYTDGGPWFEDYKDCDFAKNWIEKYEEINISGVCGEEK